MAASGAAAIEWESDSSAVPATCRGAAGEAPRSCHPPDPCTTAAIPVRRLC